MPTLTALFIGLGSIGSRHLKNLHTICAERGITLAADALRSSLNRPLRPGVAELLRTQFTALDDPAAREHYDLAFITNPTSLHAETLQSLRGRAGALFIEKPIFSADQAGLDPAALLDPGQKAYVAAPMRWCGVMLALKKAAGSRRGRPALLRAGALLVLPAGLAAGRRLRTVYSAHKAMGGGG